MHVTFCYKITTQINKKPEKLKYVSKYMIRNRLNVLSANSVFLTFECTYAELMYIDEEFYHKKRQNCENF